MKDFEIIFFKNTEFIRKTKTGIEFFKTNNLHFLFDAECAPIHLIDKNEKLLSIVFQKSKSVCFIFDISSPREKHLKLDEFKKFEIPKEVKRYQKIQSREITNICVSKSSSPLLYASTFETIFIFDFSDQGAIKETIKHVTPNPSNPFCYFLVFRNEYLLYWKDMKYEYRKRSGDLTHSFSFTDDENESNNEQVNIPSMEENCSFSSRIQPISSMNRNVSPLPQSDLILRYIKSGLEVSSTNLNGSYLSFCGNHFFVSVSLNGTTINLFDTQYIEEKEQPLSNKNKNSIHSSWTLIKSFWRGKSEAKIRLVECNLDETLFCVLTNRWTVHIFSLLKGVTRKSYFSVFKNQFDVFLDRSFAYFRIPTMNEDHHHQQQQQQQQQKLPRNMNKSDNNDGDERNHSFHYCGFNLMNELILIDQNNGTVLLSKFDCEKGGSSQLVKILNLSRYHRHHTSEKNENFKEGENEKSDELSSSFLMTEEEASTLTKEDEPMLEFRVNKLMNEEQRNERITSPITKENKKSNKRIHRKRVYYFSINNHNSSINSFARKGKYWLTKLQQNNKKDEDVLRMNLVLDGNHQPMDKNLLINLYEKGWWKDRLILSFQQALLISKVAKKENEKEDEKGERTISSSSKHLKRKVISKEGEVFERSIKGVEIMYSIKVDLKN